MSLASSKLRISPGLVWIAAACAAGISVVAMSKAGQPASVAGQPIPATPRPAPSGPSDVQHETIAWRLNNPSPHVVPESRANPVAVVDKFASRVRAMEQRAALRAFEGAPPVIPHPIADLNVQTCRACHGDGLKAGDKVAKMVPHTNFINCTQCHVEAQPAAPGTTDLSAGNLFTAFRSSGYGGTRAWAGAPPVMPHTTFMRTNCVSCHGEHGYDGWRPDHLSRANCTQCHVPAAEFEQLAPSFGVPDVPDGQSPVQSP